MIQEVGGGGVPYDARRSACIQTYIDYTKSCILQHFVGCNEISAEKYNKKTKK